MSTTNLPQDITNYVYKLGDVPATGTTFPALVPGGAGMQRIVIPPGHLLTPHWHPNATETTYCLSGKGTVSLVIPDATSDNPIGAAFKPFAFEKDDVVLLPQGYAHYFENTGDEDFVILLTFDNPNFDILTLADVLQQLPGNITNAAEGSVPHAGSSPVILIKK